MKWLVIRGSFENIGVDVLCRMVREVDPPSENAGISQLQAEQPSTHARNQRGAARKHSLLKGAELE